ncbi:ribosome small subunit-dependent GTPase A [Nocardia cyriacigeorgica]|uniref:ribosome small subunit-dependent GTPase A n=1 Tax=Nocardia cyriacigeorgica TaxID=135487 RepID=UPI001892DC79|nr:ribosome small subunit-dependent GTPase A [Nocardia cyriacigeorgica]MBF6315378.1 ribosome small subunit-dependent GTPase A [Nocardia cyriacigeorgica]MBF6515764.1 ribosome small subunit-dependent GTPase A [Nocardia cyriacigeorgica]MBF6530164.1 ribosome small subunit-dependent GTPase A [Nocardia cyriacigeorgica]
MVDYDLLIPYGWTDSVRLDYAALLESECVPARVIRMDRGECDVATPTGPRRAICPRSDSEVSGLCTGDWVLIDAAMIVRRLLPRRSAIVRTTASRDSRAQVLAANVDTVLICTAADGDVDLGRIERMLALTWESQAQPVVVLTKADAAEYLPLDEVRAVAPGATVVAVSATSEYGLDVLTALLDGTVALIGPSGAGKSTLANALLGADVFATNDVRAVDKKGKHTTVHRELRPLPGGGTLIDTPGLRGIGLWEASEGLERTFSDIEALAADCRFSDCAHDAEPGCAVRAAIDSGEITERRLDSYRKLARENEWMAARSDKRLRAEREKVWRDISKQHRRMFREKNSRR